MVWLRGVLEWKHVWSRITSEAFSDGPQPCDQVTSGFAMICRP